MKGHRPVYRVTGVSDGAVMQNMLEDLLKKYNVDIYLSGHVHEYVRTYPVYDSNFTLSYDSPPSTTHIVIGNAGNDEGNEGSHPTTAPYVAYLDNINQGTGILSVLNRTHVHWQYVLSPTAAVADEFWLTKNSEPPPSPVPPSPTPSSGNCKKDAYLFCCSVGIPCDCTKGATHLVLTLTLTLTLPLIARKAPPLLGNALLPPLGTVVSSARRAIVAYPQDNKHELRSMYFPDWEKTRDTEDNGKLIENVGKRIRCDIVVMDAA